MPVRLFGLVAAGILLAANTQARDETAALAQIDRLLDSHYPALRELYEDLHAHPELAFEETRTAARLAKEMRALGFEVTEGVGRTGVVAIFRNGEGPTVLVRTDMDGLPMQERSDLPYASRQQAVYNDAATFVAHACGHDIHMTGWVGTARSLVALRSRWRGTLMFVAQPAEERVRGARAMLEDGLYQRFGRPDLAFALHVMPHAYGEVLYRPGAMTSNGSALEIRFEGRGGHGSNPSDTIDPVLMAARFVVDVQSVVSREKDPAAFGVVSVGVLQGGSAGNIIPDNVLLKGTIRSQSPQVHAALVEGVQRTADAVARMARAPSPLVKISTGTVSAMNDVALTARSERIFKAAFGDKAILMPAAWSGGEDYPEFIRDGIPSLYFGIGIYDPDRVAAARAGGPPLPANHAPDFLPVPEPTLRHAVRALSLVVLGNLPAR
jgi:amidohydrolase